MYIPHFPLSFISQSKNSSMLCYSARVLILNSNIVTRQFCSISRRTLLNSLHLSSIPFFSYPINSESSSSYINHPNSATSTSTLFLGLRLDHTMPNIQSVHDFTVKDASGNEVDLGKYKGKVLLIVNVASQCGLTNSNYTELSQLYKTYKDQGLEILAFPCNQFGGQEPGTNEEIKKFACTRFKAEYPIFDKVDVNGDTAAPLYKYLKSSKGGLLGNDIKWNFSKFLVDKDGKVVERYAPTTSPLSIEKDIKKLLGIA